jgi:alkanesulfonate monooxygenase SsuD/methylene tetrahydromethanopterin reductase-like flavin-dependent oxidoreductase (luciferase family)
MPVDPWPEASARARELEAMGYAHLWVYDHLSWRHYQDRPWHATFPWLTGLAAATERIGLGTMVASPNLRHPLSLAKEAMTVDNLSQGRLILGLGAGTSGFDASVFGDKPLTPAQRADRLIEYTEVVDRLLRFEQTNHDGPWYTVDEGRVLPGCVQTPRVPLAIAAGGRRTIGLAAAVGDIWITLGDPASEATGVDPFLQALAGQSRQLRQACETRGRDDTEIARLAFLPAKLTEPFQSLELFVDTVGRLGELGFDQVVIHDARADDPNLDFDPELVVAIGETYR